MTLTLELPPAMERGLESAAHRHGMALEKYALDVLAREAEDEALEAQYKSVFEALAETEKAAAACTMPNWDEHYVSRIIHNCREERHVELMAVNRIVVEPEPYDSGDRQ